MFSGTIKLQCYVFIIPFISIFQTCLSEQEEPTQGIEGDIEMFSTKELAYYMTLFDWDLLW